MVCNIPPLIVEQDSICTFWDTQKLGVQKLYETSKNVNAFLLAVKGRGLINIKSNLSLNCLE
jgi:hypothetical protein